MPSFLYFENISSGAMPYTIMALGERRLTSSAKPSLKYSLSAWLWIHPCVPTATVLFFLIIHYFFEFVKKPMQFSASVFTIQILKLVVFIGGAGLSTLAHLS